MLIETVFRSEDLPSADRFDCWRELIGQTHAPLELHSDHRADFRASQRVLNLGAVLVWPTTFQPVCFRRTPKLIRQSDPEGLHLSLPLSGALRTVLSEEVTVHNPNSLCVVDTSRPVDVYGGDGSRSHTGIGLEIPKAGVALPRNKVDHAARFNLSVQEGFGALLAQLLTQLAQGVGSYQPADGPRLGAVVADLLTGLFAHALEAENLLTPESHRRTLVLRIRAFVRSHLHDPQLTPRSIAPPTTSPPATCTASSSTKRRRSQPGYVISDWSTPAATLSTRLCAPPPSTPSPPAGASLGPPTSPEPSAPPTACRLATAGTKQTLQIELTHCQVNQGPSANDRPADRPASCR